MLLKSAECAYALKEIKELLKKEAFSNAEHATEDDFYRLQKTLQIIDATVDMILEQAETISDINHKLDILLERE